MGYESHVDALLFGCECECVCCVVCDLNISLSLLGWVAIRDRIHRQNHHQSDDDCTRNAPHFSIQLTKKSFGVVILQRTTMRVCDALGSC